MSMTLGLTGATGLVGGAVLQRLLEQGYQVKALTRSGTLERRKNLEVIEGDITSPEDLEALCSGCDVVIHCAGLVKAPDKESFHRVNAKATQDIARIARQKGVSRFLYISSLAARKPEISPYAKSKYGGERALEEVQGLKWDILRPPAVYGPTDRQILTFFKLLKYRLAIIPKVRNSRISLIHVDDLADAIYAWVASKQATLARYEVNGAGQSAYSWQEIIQLASDIMEIRALSLKTPKWVMKSYACLIFWPCKIMRITPQLGPDKIEELFNPDWEIHDERFEEVFGWSPKINLESGFQQTLIWYYQHSWL